MDIPIPVEQFPTGKVEGLLGARIKQGFPTQLTVCPHLGSLWRRYTGSAPCHLAGCSHMSPRWHRAIGGMGLETGSAPQSVQVGI